MAFGGKIIVILGPTASGKSDLAVKIAKKYNGEIISADSRQVYKGMDIGTGKLTKQEMKGIPHYLLNVAGPKRIFTVIDYKKLAEKAVRDILKREKIPIICGGTGFYIQTIVNNVVIPEVKPNWKLRKQLEKRNTAQLFKMLKKIDPRRAKEIDRHNPRRLIRAIEIAKMLGKVPNLDMRRPSYRPLWIGIKLPEKELKKRIEKRVKKMIKDGLIKETKKLHKSPSQGGQGLSWKRIYELGFEYKYPAMLLQNKINRDELLEKMVQENCKYVKRQITWFRRDKRIKWVKNQSQTDKLVKKFL